MNAYFVTGAGTEIGKTYVSCALLRAWRQSGVAASALKPVVSGYVEGESFASDPALLLDALGVAPTPERIACIAPWRFKAPLAPPLAAQAEGASLSFDEIVAFCQAQRRAGGAAMLIEGAGGVMAPLTDTHTALDLIAALQTPVIFVTGDYLGAVSHALTGLTALATREAPVAAIVVNESEASVGLEATGAMIAAHTHAPIILAWRNETTWAVELAARLAP